MYPQPFVPALAGPREYPFASAFPLRLAWLRPVEEVRRAQRKGKWIAEEEEYTQKIIECFNKGFLNIAQGTTLRSCLSENLNCDPMRITKKFAGSSCIGKQVYQPCEKTPENLEEMKKAQAELSALERKFLAKVEHVTRPHRYPYIVYGAEPLPIAPDTAPVDTFRAVAHSYPLAPHSDPYASYGGLHAGMSPPRTFFPAHERVARPVKAEVSPKSPTEGAVSENADPAPQDRPESSPSPRGGSQPDLEGGGLLLSFAKIASNKQRPAQEQDADDEEREDSRDNEDRKQEAPEEQETRRETHAPGEQHASGNESSPPMSPPPRPTSNTPKRPSTLDEASLAGSRKRRVPESFAAQAYSQASHHPHHPHHASASATASYAHARAAASLPVDHRVPGPPVPPLDFQPLRGYAYPTSRSYLPEYGYSGMPPYLTDPLRRVPFPVYDSPHHLHYRTAAHAAAHAAHVAHVQHSLAAYPPPPPPPSYGSMPGHPEIADVHLYGPPPPPS